MKPDSPSPPLPRTAGFVLPTAVFLLVVLGGLAVWIMRLTELTHAQDALEVEGARAYQAAQAGIEAGVFAASQTGNTCTQVNQTVTFASTTTLSRFTASVACASSTATEGGTTLTFFQITSVACNQPSSGACPNPTPTSPEYVERHLRATVQQ